MNTAAQLHLASQYLATAGKSFLEHQSDDSHTNVGFFTEDHTLRTWPLNEVGIYLALGFDNFELQWNAPEGKIAFSLDGKTHNDIVTWVSQMASASKFEKSYSYNLHYDLPYTLPDNFKFGITNRDELASLLQIRILAQNVLETFLKNENLKSGIRIWPHHFDTGAFVVLNDGSGKSVGMGLAIPDSLVNDHYFYISAYHGHDSLDTANLGELSHGEWKNEGFKGAILPASIATETSAVQFFQEAFKAYAK